MKNNHSGLTLAVSSTLQRENDAERKACARILASVIVQAAQDARQGNASGVKFFTDSKSSFVEMCNTLNLDSNSIKTRVLKGSSKCPSLSNKQTYCVSGNVPLPS